MKSKFDTSFRMKKHPHHLAPDVDAMQQISYMAKIELGMKPSYMVAAAELMSKQFQEDIEAGDTSKSRDDLYGNLLLSWPARMRIDYTFSRDEKSVPKPRTRSQTLRYRGPNVSVRTAIKTANNVL
jgi:hypothetical protein